MQKYKQISYDERVLIAFIKTSFPACVTQSGRDAPGHSGIIKVQELLNNRQKKIITNEIFSTFAAL